MAWFDGTYNRDEERLKEEYPVVITRDLRTSEDGTRLALVNRFDEDSELYRLSDPHAEKNDHIVFYHVFTEEAEKVRKVISEYADSYLEEDPFRLSLYRKDPEELILYAYGHLCKSLLSKQDELTALLPKDFSGKEVFILPLRMYRYKCPVCGYRTLPDRGMYDICPECGWEDEGIDSDDIPSRGANLKYTIGAYREEYLKLKAEDPDYSWTKECDRLYGRSDANE